MAKRAAPTIAAVSKSEPKHAEPTGSAVPSLRREPQALLELLALVLVVCVALALGGAVNAPMHDAGCDGVIAFELARPSSPPTTVADDTAVEGTAPAASPPASVRGLRTIDGVVADCGSDLAVISNALHESTRTDFGFIAVYILGLGWCCARAAGLRPGRLAHVESSQAARTIARVGMWFALAAGLCDVVENALLLRTADHLGNLEHGVVVLTGAAAGAKFLLVVLPIAVTAWMLIRLLLKGLPAGIVPSTLGQGIGPARLRLAYEQIGGVDVEASETAVPGDPPTGVESDVPDPTATDGPEARA